MIFSFFPPSPFQYFYFFGFFDILWNSYCIAIYIRLEKEKRHIEPNRRKKKNTKKVQAIYIYLSIYR